MNNELRWALLVLCFCGCMALVYSIDFPRTCLHGENFNSPDQGCISSQEVKLGELCLISAVFLGIFAYEFYLTTDSEILG